LASKAASWLARLLQRFPDHQHWPWLASRLINHYDLNGQPTKADALCVEILSRFSNSQQWHWYERSARYRLEQRKAPQAGGAVTLAIPMVDYESYLSHNWLALLANIRYWRGEEISESEIKISLRTISRNDEDIKLYSLDNFADLDDAAQNLGYEVLLLPARLATIKALLEGGFPVLYQHYKYLSLLSGYDDSRGVIKLYSFSKISERLRNEAHKEADEILSVVDEGKGGSQQRLLRIANESYAETDYQYWHDPENLYMGPTMAVIYPRAQQERLFATLSEPAAEVTARSDGLRAAYISLAFLVHADPEHAIKWARKSLASHDNDLAYYLAHLAHGLWQQRQDNLHNKLPLPSRFNELQAVHDFFKEDGIREFLAIAAQRFQADFDRDTPLPWFIYHHYQNLLDRSKPGDLAQIRLVMAKRLAMNPTYNYWHFLAELEEWSGDRTATIAALQGTVSAHPYDFKAKLKLAYYLVLAGDYQQATELLQVVDPSKISHDADYHFCRAVLAEQEGRNDKARQLYQRAIEMRRFKAIYFYNYAKLLLTENNLVEAKKALSWAVKISGDDELQAKSQQLLDQINPAGGKDQ